jgi:hypothetical protein
MSYKIFVQDHYNPKTRSLPKEMRRIGLEESYLFDRIMGRRS